jgi:hypothetical protein
LIFIPVAAALFALSLMASSREESGLWGDSAGPGAFSRSAVGYAGCYDVLRHMLPVMASTRDPLGDAGNRGTLIVAEPNQAHVFLEEGSVYQLEESKRLLLVLPKWRWLPDPDRPEWVSRMVPAPLSQARSVLALVTTRSLPIFRVEPPDDWAINEFSYKPEVSGAVQLLRPSSGMRTLVGVGGVENENENENENGALVAEIAENGRRIWILTDPDVMSNHGIGKGENAAFMVNLVKSLSETGNKNFPGKKTIVFDETVHGFTSGVPGESILETMLSFPFVTVTILTCITAALLALAGAGRFGAPLAPRPALDFGKGQLIDNSARLLDYGGHHAATLDRYVRMTLNETTRAIHAPEGLEGQRLKGQRLEGSGGLRDDTLAEWADRVGRSRKVLVSCSSILDRLARNPSDLSNLMETARLAHKWKEEMLKGDIGDGSSDGSSANREHH